MSMNGSGAASSSYSSSSWNRFAYSTALELSQTNDKATTVAQQSIPVQKRLTTGCSEIDDVLGGGILTGVITDLCGEAGAGKSQLCMQLALHSLLPEHAGGLSHQIHNSDSQNSSPSSEITSDVEGTCLYLCTEGRFPSRRLTQMASLFRRRYHNLFPSSSQPFDTERELLDRILISELLEAEEFWAFFQKDLPILVDVRQVRLIIVDSITGICRGDTTMNGDGRGRESIVRRAGWLHMFATFLREVASKYNLAVVVVNQVSALFPVDPAASLSYSRRTDSIACWQEHIALEPFPPSVRRVSCCYFIVSDSVSCWE